MADRGRARLQVVEPGKGRAVDITLAMRADIKARDWRRVHIEADRRPFLACLGLRRWSWSNPAPQGRGGER